MDGSVCGILHSVNDGLADVVKSDEMRLLYGRDFFMEKLFDLEFKVSVYSFFQTNSAGAEKLYSIVKEFAGDVADKTVFACCRALSYDQMAQRAIMTRLMIKRHLSLLKELQRPFDDSQIIRIDNITVLQRHNLIIAHTFAHPKR